MKKEILKCIICEKEIRKGKEIWAEFSNTDGRIYLHKIPDGHESLGFFPIGSTCKNKTITPKQTIK